MVFVAKPLRYDTPPEILDHLMLVWQKPVPFDKDIFVFRSDSGPARRVEGDFYAGRVTACVVE